MTWHGLVVCQLLPTPTQMAESVEKNSYNGTEYSFVTKDPTQIQDLKCPICLELVYEPVLTSCGHLFCQRCVGRQVRCPTCQDKMQFMRNRRDERRVKSLKVKCPNWEKGCEWQGDLVDTTKHTSTRCQMETTPCPKGCAEEIARGHLKKHAAECTKRVYTCPYCQFEDTFINVTTTHYTTCEHFCLMCPAGCCRQFQRNKMAEHLPDCAEELVPCRYAAIGCQEVCKRKDLHIHLQDKKDYHLERSMDKVMQLSMAVSELTLSMKSAVARVEKCDTRHLTFCPWLEITPTCYPRPPWAIKMEVVQQKESTKEWYSDPVYSHFGGYKMCLRVDANGNGDAKGTHVSVYICLMRGDHDDNLKWPFKGTIKVSLLNQLEDGQHCTRQLWSACVDIPEKCRMRVTKLEKAAGWGYPKFISHRELSYQGDKNCQFLKDNALFFRVDCFEPKLD